MGRKRVKLEEDRMRHDLIFESNLRSYNSPAKPNLTWSGVIPDLFRYYEKYWINDPSSWINTKKTKNIDTLQLDMLRHVFGIYRAPLYLENNFLERAKWSSERLTARIYDEWYFTVAQGGSLFKKCTKGTLSKNETHMLLLAPKENELIENIWWSRAYCESNNNLGVAGSISKSKLTSKTMNNEFWISVMRFFVRFPTTKNEINDLVDYFDHEYNANRNYTLKGRTLEAVRIKCEEWHRWLNKTKSIGGGTWTGYDIENWKYTTGKNDNATTWSIDQICTGNSLLAEGQAMRHCVSSYKRHCMSGNTSIWSLKSNSKKVIDKRHLTIEVNSGHIVTQLRGFANRLPTHREYEIISIWCRDRDLSKGRYT